MTIRRLTRAFMTMAAAMPLAACAVGLGAGHDSPTQGRFEFRVSPTIWTSSALKYEFRPSVGYERTLSGAGAGNFINAGAQLRLKPAQVPQAGKGLWLGAEAFYVRQLSSNGAQTMRYGVLFGLPVKEDTHGIWHFYAGGGLSYWFGTGWYLRGGIELNPKKK